MSVFGPGVGEQMRDVLQRLFLGRVRRVEDV